MPSPRKCCIHSIPLVLFPLLRSIDSHVIINPAAPAQSDNYATRRNCQSADWWVCANWLFKSAPAESELSSHHENFSIRRCWQWNKTTTTENHFLFCSKLTTTNSCFHKPNRTPNILHCYYIINLSLASSKTVHMWAFLWIELMNRAVCTFWGEIYGCEVKES